jgi:(p)ppGpp synthase/HD superfamily hydrolase
VGAMTIFDALLIAEAAHRGQVRKGPRAEPYIRHPIRVADSALTAGYDVNAQIAALLHDVAEDTTVTLDDLRSLAVPPRALELTTLLTKWWNDEKPARVSRTIAKAEYYAAILQDDVAIGLKLLDRADNLLEMAQDWSLGDDAHRQWTRRYYAKTAAEFEPLLARLASRDDLRAATARAVFQSALEVAGRNI